MAAGFEATARSIWPSIYPALLDLVQRHRSTIVFVNNRRLAERLAVRLNELADASIARAHHGSLAREQRVEIEELLKAGQIPCLVATSSLELGIDMGAVDLVIQVESPKSVARGLQRVGRAGHDLGAVSKGRIFPKFRGDLLECAVVAKAMREGLIEETHIPRNPLDVLAQQIVAICADDEISVDDLHQLVRGAYPFADLALGAARERARHARRAVPVGRVRRAPAADRLGSHSGCRQGAAGGPASRGDERGHDPRSRPLRGLPGRGRRARRRARRGDGLRGAPGADVHARCLHVAHRGDHPRSRARLSGARRTRSGAVLEGRGSGEAVRARGEDRSRLEGDRRAERCEGALEPRQRLSPRPAGREEPAHLPPRPGGGERRRRPLRPDDRDRALPRRDRRLASLHPDPVRRPRACAVGDGARCAPARLARARGAVDLVGRRHRLSSSRGGSPAADRGPAPDAGGDRGSGRPGGGADGAVRRPVP